MLKYEHYSAQQIGMATFADPPEPSGHFLWLPFGGGTSRSFAPLATRLPSTWKLQALDPPGHLLTSGQALLHPTTLCEKYLEEFGPELFQGVLLAGHSVGGLLAAHLTQLLEDRGVKLRGCVIGAARPPHQIRTAKLSGYSRSELFRWWLTNIRVNAPSVGTHDLFAVLEDSIRADITIYECFEQLGVRINKTPTLVLYGANDETAPPALMEEWHKHISRATLRCVTGQHLFVVEEPSATAEAICDVFGISEPRENNQQHSAGRLARLARRKSDENTLLLPTANGKDLPIGLISLSPGIAPHDPPWNECIARTQPALHSLLDAWGAILVRGLSIDCAAALSEAVHLYGFSTCDYVGGNSPRTHIAGRVYTSTEYPSEFEITPHSELSYDEDSAPDVVFFACAEPAETGGETPLVDLEQLAQALDAALLERFERDGIVYIRRLHGGCGLGRSWAETFQSHDRTKIEAQLIPSGAVFDWTSSGDLLIRQRASATILHPSRDTKIWFNQAEQWHPSQVTRYLDEASQADPIMQLPHDVRFGDGSIIDTALVDQVREALWAHAGQFVWRRGDLLVLDNKRIGHARRAFTGLRRILVAMGSHSSSKQQLYELSARTAEGLAANAR